MRRTTALGLTAWAALLLAALPATAEDDDLELRWSVSPFLEYDWIDRDENNDDIGGFFDQYDFVPNKSSDFPVQLGVGDASLDLLGAGQTPLLQVRFDSPTSNLGISGSQIDDPFLNQRLLVLGRVRPVAFDLNYWRFRTEEMRLFPNTADGALVLEDLTKADDRFQRDRTGFGAEIRTRVADLLGDRGEAIDDVLAPRLALRGGYEAREGHRQLRFLLEPQNRWIALSQDRDQGVGKVGGGVLMAPWQRLTLTLDFDHERFRENAETILRGDLGAPVEPQGTIGFIPDTDRFTGTAMLRSHIGERAVVEGGFQGSWLEQVEDYTPLQRAFGLRDNSVLHLAANLAADVAIWGPLSANAFFGWEQRDNDIEQNTALFNDSNGSQPSPFMDRWRRWRASVEGVYRLDAGSLVAIGGRYEAIDRTLDYSDPGLARVLPVNAYVDNDSEFYTVYGRTHLRLLRRVNLTSELGYRFAPETGYPTDLDNRVYGKLRASYTLPLERAVVLSLFARGGSGENGDVKLVDGTGETLVGSRLERDYDRSDWLWGLTATASPIDRLGVFASFFMSRDEQDYDLVTSTLQRYLQPIVPVSFSRAGSTDYQDDRLTFLLGTHVQLNEQTDGGLSYSFTHAETRYDGGSPEISLAGRWRQIDADIHSVDVEVGHWLRDGLRVLAGYRFQFYDDHSRLPESTGSVVRPFDPSTTRHIVTVGVTLTSALLD